MKPALLIWIFLLIGCEVLKPTPTYTEIYEANNPDILEVDYIYYNENHYPFSVDSLGSQFSVAAYKRVPCSESSSYDTLIVCSKSSCTNRSIQQLLCIGNSENELIQHTSEILWEDGTFWVNVKYNNNIPDTLFQLDKDGNSFTPILDDSIKASLDFNFIDGSFSTPNTIDQENNIYTIKNNVLLRNDSDSLFVWDSDVSIMDLKYIDGALYAAGQRGVNDRYYPYTSKFDINGKLLWEKKMHEGHYQRWDNLSKIALTPNGLILGVGYSGPPVSGRENNIYVGIFNIDGNVNNEFLFKTNSGLRLIGIDQITYLTNNHLRIMAFGMGKTGSHLAYIELNF